VRPATSCPSRVRINRVADVKSRSKQYFSAVDANGPDTQAYFDKTWCRRYEFFYFQFICVTESVETACHDFLPERYNDQVVLPTGLLLDQAINFQPLAAARCKFARTTKR
jgi:hypothetical protein